MAAPAAKAGFGSHLLSGYLHKKSKAGQGVWQKRFFILDTRSLTYTHGGKVRSYQLEDFRDALTTGRPEAGEFVVVFSSSDRLSDVFPEKRLHLRVQSGGADGAREWANAMAAARRQWEMYRTLGRAMGAEVGGASVQADGTDGEPGLGPGLGPGPGAESSPP
eukprot:CAMPEP_0185414748 /NCGR_PEP_ID=MMETSP1365-20130426/5996_1 /TAXON_ID=38817 /ORGANISM="Gephyrocapsa oceanica, Strain RCC1303" /LENGTH=162 /DNA_ID=CAMNT_0028017781 /DNA_START=22 /DNA_END=507 /DNA_ORIENTATION=-